MNYALREPSDEQIYAQRERFAVVERRLAPLEMTGNEITAFLDDNEVSVTWTPRSRETTRICTLTSDEFPTMKGQSLKEAVGRAAAWMEENQ